MFGVGGRKSKRKVERGDREVPLGEGELQRYHIGGLLSEARLNPGFMEVKTLEKDVFET